MMTRIWVENKSPLQTLTTSSCCSFQRLELRRPDTAKIHPRFGNFGVLTVFDFKPAGTEVRDKPLSFYVNSTYPQDLP